jgi:hypothetical protein
MVALSHPTEHKEAAMKPAPTLLLIFMGVVPPQAEPYPERGKADALELAR